jgi:formylglycine-generating enzyme required for sulfatase activity
MPRESSFLPARAEAVSNPRFVSWVNPGDGSLLRVIPAGEFVMGSTAPEIEAAKALDHDGSLFELGRETPQFRAHVPSFSIGVHVVTNQQFAQFLSAMRPSAALRALWIPDPEQILAPSREDESYSHRL